MVRMANKHVRFSDQIRQAIKDSDLTRYQIWQRTGIDQTTLSKFVRGYRGMSLESLDVLAECLGLRIVSEERRDK